MLANIDAANVLYKALVFLGGAKITGVVVGAKAPIIITSRADSYETKMASVAASVLITSKGELRQPIQPDISEPQKGESRKAI